MATQNTTLTATTTATPTISSILYVLFYRQGNNPHPQQLNFYLNEKDMKKVVDRVKLHCERMNYRFVNVRPWLTDLDKVENILLNREDEG